jgi:LmbE family N-acetylglucosaminyl deacetylase
MPLSSIEEINRHYRHIYLSPHFDDAVLSCGGTIALQQNTGQRPLVITIFGGAGGMSGPLSPFAAQVHREIGFGATIAEAVQRRREEDATACELLGADVLWLDFADALYRGYASREALFGAVERTDVAIESQVAALLLEVRSRAPLAVFYAPLGVGHHVDHQIVCSAADRLTQQGVNVKFYEDFPYVTTPGVLETRQRELGLKMESEIVEMSYQFPQKIEAIALYRSQVPQLFGSEEAMRQLVEKYHGSLRTRYPGIKVERFWQW